MTSHAPVTVRRAVPEDLESWLDLFEAVAAEGRWLGAEAPIDRRARREAFERRLQSPLGLSLVAEETGRPVGLLSAELQRGVVHLGMMVEQGWRGRGVGSALMDSCLTWAGEQGAHKVALEVWPHNRAATALYQRFGFVEEGRLRRHYRRRNGELWDAVVMGLVLDDAAPGSPEP